jgi:hypothetical protein
MVWWLRSVRHRATDSGRCDLLRMTETEKMVQEINGLFGMTGDEELKIPKFESELELLREIKEEYKRRLLEKIPKYRAVPSEALIPDMFLQALRSRENELAAESGS